MTKTLSTATSSPTKRKPAKAQAKSTFACDRNIPPEVGSELTPLTRAFVHSLIDRIDELPNRLFKYSLLGSFCREDADNRFGGFGSAPRRFTCSTAKRIHFAHGRDTYQAKK